MNETTARREDARENDGRFGEQEHSAPEAGLSVLPDFRSAHARNLDEQLTDLRTQRDALMERRREEHLLDIARALPAGITRVVFRADYDRDGEKHSLTFDHAEDENDLVNLGPALTDHLHSVAADFGSPGDFAADEWMDNEDEGYYWVELDEQTAVEHARGFRLEMKAAQRTQGGAPLHLSNGHIAWTERAMRVRAHEAGISAIHLEVPEDAAGVRVVGFEHLDYGTITPADSNGDHMFIVGQAQQLPHRTDAMVKTSAPGAHLTMKV